MKTVQWLETKAGGLRVQCQLGLHSSKLAYATKRERAYLNPSLPLSIIKDT